MTEKGQNGVYWIEAKNRVAAHVEGGERVSKWNEGWVDGRVLLYSRNTLFYYTKLIHYSLLWAYSLCKYSSSQADPFASQCPWTTVPTRGVPVQTVGGTRGERERNREETNEVPSSIPFKSLYRVAHLVAEHYLLTSDSKVPPQDNLLIIKRNFKWGVFISAVC